ncbi:MAG: hypothetical protein JW819_03990 [Candidatus Krumholzibacteriota bacterium]|nr:hypothetical protein [Candidatus Krumholzibacteriota bacterium]
MRVALGLVAAVVVGAAAAEACTSAVVSGRATADGRPLLWKQRDTETLPNALKGFAGERFRFVGVVNADSSAAEQVWMGANEAGLAVMNTASYNMDYEPAWEGSTERGGAFMLRALGSCATAAEFERLLDETDGERETESNFGVIDATGAAAYYEAHPFAWVKFDATDPLVAPDGYLIRTNFSATGADDRGFGFIRHETASELFVWELATAGAVTADFLILEAARSLRHSLLGTDLWRGPRPRDAGDRTIIPFNDYVARYYTVSAMVVEGVRPGEDASLTTLWTVLGCPLATPVFPVWVDGDADLPEILRGGAEAEARLNRASLDLKPRLWPLGKGSGPNYLDLAALINAAGTGVLQRVLAEDRRTLAETRPLLDAWRQAGARDERAARRLQARIAERLAAFYGSAD